MNNNMHVTFEPRFYNSVDKIGKSISEVADQLKGIKEKLPEPPPKPKPLTKEQEEQLKNRPKKYR